MLACGEIAPSFCQGEEIHDLLLQHGTMEGVECQIEHVHEDEDEEQLQGGHHCRATLLQLGWTETLDLFHRNMFALPRDMITHSREWAAARGLVTKNEVHGDDEWRIPVMRGFTQTSRDRNTRRATTSFMTQARVHACAFSLSVRMTLVSCFSAQAP